MAESNEAPSGELARLEQAHASGGVMRRPVTIVRATGSRLWDGDGREYLDLSAAHGWAALGHSHPAVTQAIQTQSEALVAHTESSYNDQRALWFDELGAILRDHLGTTRHGAITRIHPCSSGTEAVETALKLARLATGRTEVVAMTGGFHGRTLGALSATGEPKYRTPFEPLVPGFVHVPMNDLAALDAAVSERTAAVIVEVIQGEGGVRPATTEFLAHARRVCDARGALLIADEIQTGLGRTGKWFACEHAGLAPDVVTLGKALGGGIPMGAAAWREGLGTFVRGTHGSTFGGNPLACAASRAVLRVLREDRLPERASRVGTGLKHALTAIASRRIVEVRGEGLMIGIELRQRATPILKTLMDRGIWALPAGERVLRLLPPLTIDEAQLDRAVQVLTEVLRAGT